MLLCDRLQSFHYLIGNDVVLGVGQEVFACFLLLDYMTGCSMPLRNWEPAMNRLLLNAKDILIIEMGRLQR